MPVKKGYQDNWTKERKDAWKKSVRDGVMKSKLHQANAKRKHTEETKKNLREMALENKQIPPSRLGKGKQFYMSNGYRVIPHDKEHPRAAKSGWVMEHILIMEKHLGRFLEPKEVVHHIDSDRANNDIDNLMLFPTQGAHLKYHAYIRRLNK